MRRVHDIVVHMVWTVRHRSLLLDESDDARRIELFRHKTFDAGAELIAAGCANDHVHVLVRIPATHTIAEIAKRLKGSSSRVENLSRPDRRFEWQDGYWCQSCDPLALEGVLAYVRGQREHHRATVREPWEDSLDEAAGR
jgi:putative transposase